ncbi:MAG TPA: thymidylate synthase [Candidatus Moranbacteria bacterium]|nr:thymidylate synthase [Candidatus Moranbacteria bacterium]
MQDIARTKPVEERTPDNQYKAMLRDVLENGVRAVSQQGTDAITRIGSIPMRFKLENGFPMITERNMAPKMSKLPVTIWQQAIGEICAFINGARTVEELEKFGCYWWDIWCTEKKCSKRGLETGDLGPGSYGAAFHDFPTITGETFNQFKHIVEQIKEEPQLRTHFVSPWIPQYAGRGKGKTQKVVVCPCHGWLNIRIIDGKLTLHMMQRSGDTPIGVPSNMVQYAALAMMLAHVTNTIPYEYVHTISDAHIFVDQIPAVEKMLERESRPFPTMKINTAKTDLFDFRKEDFELSDYNPHPGIKGIPVAI